MTHNDYEPYFTISKEEFHQRINDNLFTHDDNNFINFSSFYIETYTEAENSEEYPIFEFQDINHNSNNEAPNYEENGWSRFSDWWRFNR